MSARRKLFGSAELTSDVRHGIYSSGLAQGNKYLRINSLQAGGLHGVRMHA